MNSMKLVIPLHSISWKKTPNDAVTPQRQSQFTPKMKANAVPRLLSSLVWIDHYDECNGMTSFMEFLCCSWILVVFIQWFWYFLLCSSEGQELHHKTFKGKLDTIYKVVNSKHYLIYTIIHLLKLMLHYFWLSSPKSKTWKWQIVWIMILHLNDLILHFPGFLSHWRNRGSLLFSWNQRSYGPVKTNTFKVKKKLNGRCTSVYIWYIILQMFGILKLNSLLLLLILFKQI